MLDRDKFKSYRNDFKSYCLSEALNCRTLKSGSSETQRIKIVKMKCLYINRPGIGLIAGLLLFVAACKTPERSTGQIIRKEKTEQADNLFFTYDFTLEKKTVKERVRFLDSLGYQGVTFPVNTPKGPIALHTFGLKEPINEHFSKSLDVWRKMCGDISGGIRNWSLVNSH